MVHESSTGFDGPLGQYSLRDLLTIIFKRRALILSVMIGVMTMTIVISFLLPRTYQVSASLLVDSVRVDVPIGPAEGGQVFVNQVSEQHLNSEIEILKSRQMIEDVVRTLDVDQIQRPERSRMNRVVAVVRRFFGGMELSRFEAMIVRLQEDIWIGPVRRTNMIRIGYESEDAEWATRVVRTLTERYLERKVERSQSSEAVEFFEQQMVDAEIRLSESERTLEKFVSDAEVTIVAGEQDSDALVAQKELVMGRLANLEAEHGDAEVALESRLREGASLRRQIGQEPERLVSTNRQNQDATSEEIERALAALRLERDALLQDFKPDSRHVRDIDTQIGMAEARLEQGKQRTIFGGTEPNPIYVQLKGELLRIETETEGIRATIVSLAGLVAENQVVLRNLNRTGFDLENLLRTAQAAEDDYLLYRKKHEEARISAAMDQEKFINVTIVQPAQRPLQPVPRGLLLRFLMAVVVGLLGGFGIAFGVDQFLNRSFTTGQDIERKLGIPHIASIPLDSARADC